MDTQRILQPSNKVTIIADYREREVIGHLRDLGALVNETNLKVGDFVCSSDGIVIERKSHSDFVSSIIDGRIFDQGKYLKENYKKPIVLIEGFSDREIDDNAFKATVASLVSRFNISFINTKNTTDTAKMIYWIAKKEQEGSKMLGFKQGKKPKTTKQMQEFILSGIPGISTVLAKRLLERFGNIENVVNSKGSELEKVKGVGNKLAGKIKKLFTDAYE